MKLILSLLYVTKNIIVQKSWPTFEKDFASGASNEMKFNKKI